MIYDNEFERIWDNIIEPLVESASVKFGLKYKKFFYIKPIMRYLYQKYKDIIVKSYMLINTTNIDRHKIASCIMKAILVVKPLYIPLNKKLKFLFSSKDVRYDSILDCEFDENEKRGSLDKYFLFYNEYLALGVAIAIVNSYINSDDKEGRFKHDIVMPEPFPEPDTDYLLDVCIGLHYTKKSKINTITYANVMFLWEKYSCRRERCNNLKATFENYLKEFYKSDETVKRIINDAEIKILEIEKEQF